MNKINPIPVMTVDGPSGSGKGTLSVKIAKTLNWHFLDSGAIYRLLGLFIKKQGISTEAIDAIAQSALNLPIKFSQEGRAWLLNKDVSDEIRTEEVGLLASTIAKHPIIRQNLLERQIVFRKMPGLVADGRDMGTVVFPDATLKFYLEASAEVRAKRRYLQLQAQGHNVSLDNLFAEINQRDLQDKTRVVSPLIPAPDAIKIDTTDLSIDDVYEAILSKIKLSHAHWLTHRV